MKNLSISAFFIYLSLCFIFKESDRLDVVVKLRLQYCREISKIYLITINNFSARAQIQSLKSSWIVHSEGSILSIGSYKITYFR